MVNHLRTLPATLTALLALAGTEILSGQIHLIPIGSSLTFGGTNAPDTYSATTTFSSTPVLVDNAKVRIWQEQKSTGPISEWDIFHVQIVNGGPLAGNINANWNILMNYTLSAPVFFDQVVQQWSVNGTPVSPISNFSSICCAALSNPIVPGPAYYKSGFSVPYPAGVFMNWQQIFADPYSIIAQGGINPSTANEFTFALHFTLQTGPPTVTGAISAGAYGGFKSFAPGSWIEIYGMNLASTTQEWAKTDFSGVNAPTMLGGTSVSIGGQMAFVRYISPMQVNVQVPAGVATGSQSLTLTTAQGTSAPFTVNIVSEQPGLLAPPSFNIGGTQYVVAVFQDGTTYVLPPGAIPGITSRRAKPGDTITLYGIGFGSVNPNIPPGQIATQLNTVAMPLTMAFGVTQAGNPLPYAGLAPNFVGLYQFNVVVPNVAASDSVPLTFSLGGTGGTQALSVAVGN